MGGRHIFTFWKKKESFLSFVIKHSWLQQIKRHVLNKIPNSIQYLLQLACYQMFLELFLVIEIISKNFYISVTYGRNVRNIKDWFWTSLGFYLVEYALLFQWLLVRFFEIFEYNDYQVFRPYNDDILFESTISWIWNLFNCYISHWDPDYKPTLTGESVI